MAQSTRCNITIGRCLRPPKCSTSSRNFAPATDEILAEQDATSGAINWQITDRQQSVRDVVTFNGTSATVADHLAYNAYGELVTETQPTVAHRFGYTGQEYDAATGLYYDNARYYDQVTGRFISVDPSGFSAGDANLYRYVHDNPSTFIDPTGLHIETADDEQGSNIVLGLNKSPQTFVSLAVAGPVTLGGQTVNADSYSSGGYSSAINTSSILSGFATPTFASTSSYVGPISSPMPINLSSYALGPYNTTSLLNSSNAAALAGNGPTYTGQNISSSATAFIDAQSPAFSFNRDNYFAIVRPSGPNAADIMGAANGASQAISTSLNSQAQTDYQCRWLFLTWFRNWRSCQRDCRNVVAGR